MQEGAKAVATLAQAVAWNWSESKRTSSTMGRLQGVHLWKKQARFPRLIQSVGQPAHSHRTNATVMVSLPGRRPMVEFVRRSTRRTVWIKHTNRLKDENMHISYVGLTPVCVLEPDQSATILLSPTDAAEPPDSAFHIVYRREAETARQQARARLKLQAKQAAVRFARRGPLLTGIAFSKRQRAAAASTSAPQGGSGGGGTKRKFHATTLATIGEDINPGIL